MTPENIREMYTAVKADPDGNGKSHSRGIPSPRTAQQGRARAVSLPRPVSLAVFYKVKQRCFRDLCRKAESV